MTLNDQIYKKAKQTRQEAVSFENALAAQFKNLTDKTGNNLKIITKQVDLHRDIADKENTIANEFGIISAMLSKNALLESLVFAKIEEKLSVFPKKTEDDEIKEPIVTEAPKAPKKKKKKPSFSLPSIPLFPRKPRVSSPPKSMASGGFVGGNSKIAQQTKQNSAIPYADTMQLSLEASGLAAVSTLGEFIKGTGALGGFFLPYYKSIVEPFALALGVSKDSLYILLGGPLQTASLTLKDDRKYFGKMWGKFLKDSTFVDKYIDREAQPGPPGPPGSGSDFWTLAAVVSMEAGDPQHRADVAQSIYNRLAEGSWGKSIAEILTSENQYESAFNARGTGNGINPLFKSIVDVDSAAKAVQDGTKRIFGRDITLDQAKRQVEEAAKNITDKTLQTNAASFIGNRTDFRAYSPPGGGDVVRPDGGNHFFNDGPRKLQAPAPVPSFARGGSLQTIAPLSLILGSKSGYPVSLDGKTTAFTGHGFEIIENGKVYPIDTPAFNLFANKEKTFVRWAEIYYDKSFDINTAIQRVTSNPVATSEVAKPKVIINSVPGDQSSSVNVTSTDISSRTQITNDFNPHLFNQERYLLSLK